MYSTTLLLYSSGQSSPGCTKRWCWVVRKQEKPTKDFKQIDSVFYRNNYRYVAVDCILSTVAGASVAAIDAVVAASKPTPEPNRIAIKSTHTPGGIRYRYVRVVDCIANSHTLLSTVAGASVDSEDGCIFVGVYVVSKSKQKNRSKTTWAASTTGTRCLHCCWTLFESNYRKSYQFYSLSAVSLRTILSCRL